jgi:hypothetical protein
VDDDQLLGGAWRFVEQFQAHVAAGPGPFVSLFGQRRADQPDGRHLVREDPKDVGSLADLSYRSTGGRTGHMIDRNFWDAAQRLGGHHAGTASRSRA